jgi:hypothetical protein
MSSGIPIAALQRTLLDYVEVARPQQLRHAVEAAERRRRAGLPRAARHGAPDQAAPRPDPRRLLMLSAAA